MFLPAAESADYVFPSRCFRGGNKSRMAGGFYFISPTARSSDIKWNKEGIWTDKTLAF